MKFIASVLIFSITFQLCGCVMTSSVNDLHRFDSPDLSAQLFLPLNESADE